MSELGVLFAFMNASNPRAGHGKRRLPTGEELRRQQPFYQVVFAESGVLLFHGGELAQVIASPAPKTADDCFEIDCVRLVPSWR